MPTCGGSPGNGRTSPTRTSRGAGSSPGTSACSTRPGRTSGCSGAGRPAFTSASSPGRKSSGTGWSPGGRPPTIPPSPGTGSSGDAANRLPVDPATWHLLRRQRGRCPLCRGLLLHADRQPQSPEEWQQWHTVTRKAIRKHAIDSVTDLGTPDGRVAYHLIHAHCRPPHRERHQPGASARFAALRACLSRAARKAGTAGSEGTPARQRAGVTRRGLLLDHHPAGHPPRQLHLGPRPHRRHRRLHRRVERTLPPFHLDQDRRRDTPEMPPR